jgi:V/A-type H+-transporting ATPase subunit E
MNKIQELTEQLLREGVEKGNQQAADIVAQAEAKKAEILAAAQKQAEEMLAAAQKQAEELDKNTKAELKLFANQALEALKSEVINLLNDKVVSESMDQTLTEKFMPQLILTFVQNWASKGELIIETADEAALTAYFKKEAADALKAGL